MIPSPELRPADSVDDQVRAAAERLKEENDELRQMNAALSRSNQDLERFAFAASHDLQEPLRAIIIYAELLARKCCRELDTDSAMFVRNIVEGGKRMRDLLADLLAYAEIRAVPDESAELVDLNVVLKRSNRTCECPLTRTAPRLLTRTLDQALAGLTFLAGLC